SKTCPCPRTIGKSRVSLGTTLVTTVISTTLSTSFRSIALEVPAAARAETVRRAVAAEPPGPVMAAVAVTVLLQAGPTPPAAKTEAADNYRRVQRRTRPREIAAVATRQALVAAPLGAARRAQPRVLPAWRARRGGSSNVRAATAVVARRRVARTATGSPLVFAVRVRLAMTEAVAAGSTEGMAARCMAPRG